MPRPPGIISGGAHAGRNLDIQDLLAEGNTQATEGAAVVMTTTGRVIAMASYPTYNPSVWTGGLSEDEFKALFGTANSEPVLDRATQGQYHPGSTWPASGTRCRGW